MVFPRVMFLVLRDRERRGVPQGNVLGPQIVFYSDDLVMLVLK